MGKISWFLSKYNYASLFALIVIVVGLAILVNVWSHIIVEGNLTDPLLIAIWFVMTAILCWNISAERDLVRVFVAVIGGLFIEAWGTQTNLWYYYTSERPPIWILPAWPVATLAIDRLARVVEYFMSSIKVEKLWWPMVLAYPFLMLEFVWPSRFDLFTIVGFIVSVGVFLLPCDKRQDVTLMIAGASLGYFLEYWGTTRFCWTYYTRETPPMFPVFAHGLATICFQRVAVVVELGLEYLPYKRAQLAALETVPVKQNSPMPKQKKKRKRAKK